MPYMEVSSEIGLRHKDNHIVSKLNFNLHKLHILGKDDHIWSCVLLTQYTYS